MTLVLVTTILLRLLAAAIAARTWHRVRDARIGLVVAAFALAALQPLLDPLLPGSSGADDGSLGGTGSWSGLGISAGFVVAAAALDRFLAVLRRQSVRLNETIEAARKGESALRASEQRFRDFSESYGDWYWESDSEHRFISVSSEVETTGYAPSAMHGHRRWEQANLLGDPNSPQWAAHRADHEARRPFKGFRFARTSPDGRVHWYEVNGKPRFDPEGRFLGYRGITRDISTEVTAQERYRSLVEGSLQGIFVVLGGRPVFTNTAAARLFGYTVEEFLAIPSIETLMPAVLLERATASSASAAGAANAFEHKTAGKDGTDLWLQTQITRVQWDGRDAVQVAVIDVSARKRSELEREEVEARFRDVSEAYGDWFWEIDESLRITWVSAGVNRLANVTPDSVVGLHPWEAAGGAEVLERDLWTQHRLDLEARRHIRAFRFRMRVPDGSLRWIEVFGKPRFGASGEFLGYRGTGRDVTAQVQAELEFRQVTERYRGLVENSVQGTFVVQDYRVVFANRAICDVFGYSMREFLELPTTEPLYSPEDWPLIVQRYVARLAGKPVAPRFQYRGLRKDGTRIWIETEGRLVQWEGRPAVQANIIDITEQKRAEERMRSSQRLLRTVFDALPVWVVVWNRDLEYVLLNRLAMEGHGLRDELPPGQTPRSLGVGPEEALVAIENTNREILDTGRKMEEMEVMRTFPDGRKRMFHVVRVPLKDEEGAIQGVVSVAEDITEARSLRDQLYAAQRMEAVGLLAGGIAHDFNNLLAVVMSYSELLADTLAGNEPALRDLREISRAGDRAAALTRQLLAFSRKQAQQLELINLSEVLDNVELMFRRLIGAHIELRTEKPPNIGAVLADVTQIEQVIMNLVLNARDAMPGGGKLTIAIENATLDEDYCAQHPEVVEGEYVMLAVSDTGQGMSREVQQRIFEPFFTTKEQGKGTGLGLATVYGVVKQSGGSVSVYSEPGIGSTFRVYLPLADASTEKLPAAARPAAHSGSGVILLVEDEPNVRASAKRTLESAGYAVLDAANGDEAVRIAREHDGKLDLLLTDVVMPGMSGVVVAERVRPLRQGIAVLFMSGYAGDALAQHGSNDGPALLSKPFTREQLLGAVHRQLGAADVDRSESPAQAGATGVTGPHSR